MPRIIFGISGASGMPLAIHALEALRRIKGIEINLVVSEGARQALRAECGGENPDSLAHASHDPANLASPLASGSWICSGMIVCPCSMATLAAIANGCGANLLHRAADVALKERRRLILVTRETPLNLIHLRNMVAATEAGAVVMPFAPAFYTGDNSMEGAFRQFSGRMLDLLGIEHDLCERWGGG